MHNTPSNSITLTSALFTFFHLRWSQKWPLSNSPTKASINLFDHNTCQISRQSIPHSASNKNHESLHYATFFSLCYFLLVMLMIIMMMKVALPSGARIRYSSHICRLRLKCDGTRAETRFRLSAKRTSPFKSEGASVQSTAGSRGVHISCSNAGYTMFRGSVKGTGYPLHSPVSPSLPLPCVTVCHYISTGIYCNNSHDSNQG